MDTLQTSPFLLDMSHSIVLEDFREAFDSNSMETLEDINLRLLNQVNSLPSLPSRELSLRVGKTLFRNISADIFIPSDIKKKERHLIALGLVFIGEGEGGSLTYNDRILDTPLPISIREFLFKIVYSSVIYYSFIIFT